MCISLPIPIIVNNFNKFYEKAKIEEEIEAKRKKTSWEDAKRGKRNKVFCFAFLSWESCASEDFFRIKQMFVERSCQFKVEDTIVFAAMSQLPDFVSTAT